MFDRVLEFIVKKTGQVLHLPYMSLHYSLVQTLDGRVISDTGKRRAKSWTRNAYNMLISQMSMTPYQGASFGGGTLALKNRSGALISSATGCWITTGGMFSGGQGFTDYGTLIGTNNTADTFEDYNIGSLIPEGKGAGQINYGDTFWSRSYAGTTLTIRSRRYFNNNSNGNIDIGEIVLCSTSYLICREAFNPKETFMDKAQLQAVFEISLTYPS